MAIDMDEVIGMVAGHDWSTISHEGRLTACHMARRLVEAAFSDGIDLVSVAGSTLSPYEREEVANGLSADPLITRVLLRVSLQESVRRAQADPARTLTRNPAYVAGLAAGIDWSNVQTPDLDISTDGMSAEQVIRLVATALGTPSPKSERGLGGEV